MSNVIKVQSHLACDIARITQHRRAMQAAGIRTVEGCGAVHPQTNGHVDRPAGKVSRQRKRAGQSAIRGYGTTIELAELTDLSTVDEDLVGVVDTVRHFQRQASSGALHIYGQPVPDISRIIGYP